MPTSWQIECLRARIRSQAVEIKRVAEKDHPYPEPDTIYKALIKVIKERSELFEDAADLWYSEEGVELRSEAERDRALQGPYNTIVKDLQRISEVFGLADRVDSARIPFEILRSLSWVANSLLDQRCWTVVRLDTVYNYSIVSCRRKFEEFGWGDIWLDVTRKKMKKTAKKRKAKKKSAEELQARPTTVLVLGFPSPDASSILVHALAAHEFGHEIAHNRIDLIRGIVGDGIVKVKQTYNESLKEYVEDNVVMHEGVTRKDAYEESGNLVETRLLKLASNWLQEVFSDLFAARLVGPAFLAAFDRILLQLDRPSLSHPPGYLRRRLVRLYMDEVLPHVVEDPVWKSLFDGSHKVAGFVAAKDDSSGDAVNATDEEINDSFVGEDTDPTDPLTPLYPMIVTLCESNLDRLSAILENTPCPLKEHDLSEQVERMQEYIDALAPPSAALNVSGDKADANEFWLLMYAAWHYRLNEARFNTFANEHGWKDDVGKAEDALGNLVLHSLQALELRFLWEQSRLATR